MSTGIGSWANPSEIEAIYPFVGSEVLLVIAGFAFWIWWHIKQMRDENRELDKQAEYYRKIGLERAMHHGGRAQIATEDEVKANPAKVAADSSQAAPAEGPGANPAPSA